MERLTVHIDVSTPRGRRLARELYETKGVTIDNPLPPEPAGRKTYSLEEAFGGLRQRLKEHYRVEE